MRFYLYLLLGFIGGIPAGMGMGGGTVTIPLLVLVGGVEQKIAQSANLFSFLLSSALGASLAVALPSALLRRAFGAFLIGLSFVGLYRALTEKQA